MATSGRAFLHSETFDAPPASLTPTLSTMRAFKGVKGPHIHAFISAGTIQAVPAGTVIARTGDPADSGWLVVQDRIRLETGSPGRSVGDVWPGEMVGEHGVFGAAQVHVTDIIASSDSVLVALDRSTVNAPGLQSNGALAALQRHMLTVTARRLHTLDGSRARLSAKASATATTTARSAEPDTPTLMGWLRGLFGGEE